MWKPCTTNAVSQLVLDRQQLFWDVMRSVVGLGSCSTAHRVKHAHQPCLHNHHAKHRQARAVMLGPKPDAANTGPGGMLLTCTATASAGHCTIAGHCALAPVVAYMPYKGSADVNCWLYYAALQNLLQPYARNAIPRKLLNVLHSILCSFVTL